MILVGPRFFQQAQLDAALERLTLTAQQAQQAKAGDEDAARAFAQRVRDLEPDAYGRPESMPGVLQKFLRLWNGRLTADLASVRDLPSSVLQDGAPVRVVALHTPHQAACLMDECGALELLGVA